MLAENGRAAVIHPTGLGKSFIAFALVEAFRKYKEEHEDTMISFRYVDEDGMQLRQWVARMKHQYFVGKLQEGKKARLAEAGFPFHGISNQWWQHYKEAEAFYREHGRLEEDQIRELEDAGTIWDGTESVRAVRETADKGSSPAGTRMCRMAERTFHNDRTNGTEKRKMSLKLMYITNNPDIAQIAEMNGVDRILIDMEYIGKELRQQGMDTVKSHHTVEDITNVRKAVKKARLLVRCNPFHGTTDAYGSSENEINEIIERGADYVMLPYFQTVEEVRDFLGIVRGRTKTVLLFETLPAVERAEEILELDGIDEAFIGLNDLSIGYRRHFMFELLADGTVEELSLKFRKKGIPFGFGGIASVGKGALPAEKIIREHYRLFSDSVILSRSFCNISSITDIKEIERAFAVGIEGIRAVEKTCEEHRDFYEKNMLEIREIVGRL